ncbi:MAG: flavin reductase [Deltaproteobacteria bacterium]|nr:flavin reductase [Deltaproteobacteria bacterium]MBW2394173.1 flavin reductase [Deltaproteobacteria bacterium]
MDVQAKKTVLRMIPYGLYVLTAESNGNVAASTVNWVTQASFEPPLVAVGVKAGSGAHELIKKSKAFALNVLGKGQNDMAFSFFKPLEREGDSIGGQVFTIGDSGAPVLANAAASLECKLVETLEHGDHSIFLGEVIGAGLNAEIDGRPDNATLALGDLGESTFYGG